VVVLGAPAVVELPPGASVVLVVVSPAQAVMTRAMARRLVKALRVRFRVI
jgi:hypothetical protein